MSYIARPQSLSGESRYFRYNYGDFPAVYRAQLATCLRVAGSRPEAMPNNKARPWTSVDRASEIVAYWKGESQRADVLEQIYALDNSAMVRVKNAISTFWNNTGKFFQPTSWDTKTGGPFLNYDSTIEFWDVIEKFAIQLSASLVLPTSSDLWVESVIESLPECFLHPAACIPQMPTWMMYAIIGSCAVGAFALLRKR